MSIRGYGDDAYLNLRRMITLVLLFLSIWVKSCCAISTFSSSALIRLLHYWYILYLPMLSIRIVLIHYWVSFRINKNLIYKK